MLFGQKYIEDEILEIVEEYGKKNHIKPIFGAMVGSVSRGVHMADSDYDTRFLYLRDDYPRICDPREIDESELHSRYYPDDVKIYEFIPFWEFTSFIQFLKEPRFKGCDVSPSLYNLLGWTFYSPFVWDPYGIQNRIMPYMDLCFNREYTIQHHRNLIAKYYDDIQNDEMSVKQYVSCVHSAASIGWAMMYNRRPPINLQSLLYGVKKKDIWNKISVVVESSRNMVYRNIKEYGQYSELFRLHFNASTVCDKQIVKFVFDAYRESENVKELNEFDFDVDRCIDGIYDIVNTAIKDKTSLEGR